MRLGERIEHAHGLAVDVLEIDAELFEERRLVLELVDRRGTYATRRSEIGHRHAFLTDVATGVHEAATVRVAARRHSARIVVLHGRRPVRVELARLSGTGRCHVAAAAGNHAWLWCVWRVEGARVVESVRWLIRHRLAIHEVVVRIHVVSHLRAFLTTPL